MRLLLTLLCLLVLSPLVRAEQRVVVLQMGKYDSNESYTTPNLSPIQSLLDKGWRVVHVSSAGTGSQYGSDARIVTYFVLESPAAPISPPVQATQPIDLKAIWQRAYDWKRSRDVAEPPARAFADEVVAAVVDAAPVKP